MLNAIDNDACPQNNYEERDGWDGNGRKSGFLSQHVEYVMNDVTPAKHETLSFGWWDGSANRIQSGGSTWIQNKLFHIRFPSL